MTHTTENPTLELLQEKYNSTALKLNYKGEAIRGGSVTEGEWHRDGVAVLGNKEWKLGAHGEVRWVSSDNICPTDILEMAVVDGTITWEMFERSTKQNSIETTEFLTRYQAMREKHGYSEEEQMEMRAEFGDEEVVDVFTGKVIASSKLVLGEPTEKTINPDEPYVQAALNGRLGYFYAVDKQSLARTIFIARGIYSSSLSPQGVVIIKVDVPTLEYQWDVDDVSLAFFDANNVAFITNRPSIALRRIGSLDEPFLETKHYKKNQISKFFDYKKSTVLNHTI